MRRATSLCALALLAACRHDLGTLSVIGGEPAHAPAGPRVTGKDCAPWIFGIPAGAPSLPDALHAALTPGTTRLVDVRVQSSFWTTAIYGQECLIVTGTPE